MVKELSKFKIRIAGQVVELVAPGRMSYGFYRDFLTDSVTDLRIYIEEKDIGISSKGNNKDRNEIGWEGEVQLADILKKLADRLIDYDILLMHGAAIAVDGNAYIFTAPSRTGKTTHILKWLKYCPETIVINGDKPFIKINKDGSTPFVCSSPWAGKEKLYTNVMVPVKAIIIMERSENNHIERISFSESFLYLLQQVYNPEDEEKMRKTLRLMQQMSSSVSFWHFQFNNFKEDCFDVAYRALVLDQE